MTCEEMISTYGHPLIERDSAGIHVAMFYEKTAKQIHIWYSDCKNETTFTLDPPSFLALDAYHHPVFYANAALNGMENPKRLVPVTA